MWETISVYATLCYEYFKVGLFTIGGGYAMLPMVRQIVLGHGWISSSDLTNFIAVAEATPGPFAINLATFVGLEVGKSTVLGLWGGILGAVLATLSVVLPSLIIIILVTKVVDKFKTNQYVQGALVGIRPVVVGLIGAAFVTIALGVILPGVDLQDLSNSSVDTFNYTSLLLFPVFFGISKIKIKGKKIHPILMILSAAVIGILLFGVLELHL